MTETETPPEGRRGRTRRTTITPAPGSEEVVDDAPRSRFSPRELFRTGGGRLAEPLAPLPGASVLRTLVTSLLSVLCLLTVGGAILLLLLWQQQRDAGVLSTQLDRTWDLFGLLRSIERWVAFAVVPVASIWIALAVVNVRRATGRRPNPVIAALSLPIGLAGVWYVGREMVEPAEGIVGTAAAFVLQAVFLLLPLVVLLRVAVAAEARHRPMRAVLPPPPARRARSASPQVMGTLAANEGARRSRRAPSRRYQLPADAGRPRCGRHRALLGIVQFLGGGGRWSTVDENSGAAEWGRLGVHLTGPCPLIHNFNTDGFASLDQVRRSSSAEVHPARTASDQGDGDATAANEGVAQPIEEFQRHRDHRATELRSRFGESVGTARRGRPATRHYKRPHGVT